MTILAIESTDIDELRVRVTAIVENMLLISHQTLEEPAQYAPAICTAEFEMDPEEQIPLDEDGFCNYLDDLDLNWQPIDLSDAS